MIKIMGFIIYILLMIKLLEVTYKTLEFAKANGMTNQELICAAMVSFSIGFIVAAFAAGRLDNR